MVAFSASRLVCPAMVLISSTTSPIRAAAFDNLANRALEIVGELDHVRLASNRDALCSVLLLFAVEAKFGLHSLHISQRDTDLVVPRDDDAAVEQALRDFRHRPVELFKRQ